MPSSKLTAVITALLFLSGAPSANAAYNLQQLQVIEQLILAKDCGALLRYLLANPGIMSGNDPLARELRLFSEGVDGGIIQCLSAGPEFGGPGPALDPTPIY